MNHSKLKYFSIFFSLWPLLRFDGCSKIISNQLPLCQHPLATLSDRRTLVYWYFKHRNTFTMPI